ncbi:hypothetical protein LSUE1_G007268 [Lachnellula suecica]|uniref:Acetyltransferase n=1 Tax=Lachnellula suecica TaxID=602035 RepID=A0A8T9C4M4_9HELO|nr:hypothetical protein LSUE1_G007268 [Lachnellula suecica]
MSASPSTPGRLLLTLSAITTTFGGFIADWNHTHVYNPNWPPHAKFHNGQTMSLGFCLGLSTLYYTWRNSNSNTNISLEKQKDDLKTAAWLACMYWVTQLSAACYPGSLPVDPEFGDGFPQAWICAGEFVVVGLGVALEWRRLGRVKREGKRE